MPLSSSTTSSSNGVFARLTGKRQPIDTSTTPAAAAVDPLNPTLGLPAESDRPRKLGVNGGHRRESSLLSLTSSVSDLGQNVKRSVSLRSHRTQPSTGSTTAFGHRPRYPSSGNLITSPLRTSPTEEEEPQGLPSPPPPPPPPSNLPPTSTNRRGKLSISARSLSSKFRSTDNLLTLSPPDLPEQPSERERPTTAVELPRSSHSTMLVAPTMLGAAPAVPKRAPPDRPHIQPQRDLLPHGLPPPPINSNPTAGIHSPQVIYQQIHETSAKRMATIDYLRKVHDGNIFYFNTWHYSPSTMQTIPSMHPLKLGRRANNYLVLGYSLPALLDLNSSSPLEYLKALTALLNEFETYQSLSGFDTSGNSISKGRMGAMFSGMGMGMRSSKARRASTATDSISINTPSPDYLRPPQSATEASSPQDYPSPINTAHHDFQHLITPHLPFDADFATTYATLCDTLMDTYGKLMDLVASPEVCSVGVGETFAKADKGIRKILVANVLREFEEGTRASVKGEVAGLGKLVLGGLM